MSEELITIAGQDICYIGQYEENQYWMARSPNACMYTESVQSFFGIDPHKRFRSKEKCEEYIIKQVKRTCNKIFKESENE